MANHQRPLLTRYNFSGERCTCIDVDNFRIKLCFNIRIVFTFSAICAYDFCHFEFAKNSSVCEYLTLYCPQFLAMQLINHGNYKA